MIRQKNFKSRYVTKGLNAKYIDKKKKSGKLAYL